MDLFRDFSAMSLSYQEGESNFSVSYQVLHSPGSVASSYKVNITSKVISPAINSGTIWVQGNGSVSAVLESDKNVTGAAASNLAVELTQPFYQESIQATSFLPFYLSSPSVHEVNITSSEIGPTLVTMTNYAADSLPFTVSACNFTFTVSKFSFQLGRVPGSTVELTPYEFASGTAITAAGTQSLTIMVRITSLTVS
jgi:hypothetical protein